MCEHVFRVNTLRMKGFCSPGNYICQVQCCVRYPSDIKETLPSDHVCYLDGRIGRCFWKDSLSTCTFNIEAKYPERSNLRPISFRHMRNDVIVSGRISSNMKGCEIKILLSKPWNVHSPCSKMHKGMSDFACNLDSRRCGCVRDDERMRKTTTMSW